MTFKKLVAILLLGSFTLPLFAQETSDASPKPGFLERKGEGWYWYHDPKDDAPKDVPPPPPPAPAPASQPQPDKKTSKPHDDPFSVAWLRKAMPKLLDEAIDNPTKENVEAYLYAQRVAMDKSQRYAEMTQQVVDSDPFLDENNRVPLDTMGKAIFRTKLDSDNKAALTYASKISGIWLFFDSKCAYCRPEADAIQHVAKKYGFSTKFISMDGGGLPNVSDFVKDNGTAKMLHLTMTPTTVLVVPPNNYYIVSQGIMAQPQLEDRIVVALDSNDLFPKDIAKTVHTFDRGVLTPSDTKQGASDDPKEWVKYLKDRLNGRY
ncbi:conjugal transfer protein (plasmid) [Burkholderia sp. KK1]|uniref:Sex pilus assembly protein TraF n=1 Tax=Burkholderia sp. M701 TaxID=326454 RepID=V5YQR6_9BURK|nr:conjugal transfer protein TraF [Burkholderia sp. M701]AQH06025.1 conjugal transfer protein [Burkholderia sp. KK1]BAO19266.1 sex pilus assembly protein TraF [Burkholderia sp. M701]